MWPGASNACLPAALAAEVTKYCEAENGQVLWMLPSQPLATPAASTGRSASIAAGHAEAPSSWLLPPSALPGGQNPEHLASRGRQRRTWLRAGRLSMAGCYGCWPLSGIGSKGDCQDRGG